MLPRATALRANTPARCPVRSLEAGSRRYRPAVERRIDLSNLDLDQAADIIAGRRPSWLALGLIAEPLTWMDNDADWPRPLLTERDQAGRPMSLGVHLRGEATEAEIVLYAGGWADADLVRWATAETFCEYAELDNADDFAPFLDHITKLMTTTAEPTPRT